MEPGARSQPMTLTERAWSVDPGWRRRSALDRRVQVGGVQLLVEEGRP